MKEYFVTLRHRLAAPSADTALEGVLRDPAYYLTEVTVQEGQGETLYFAPSNVEDALKEIAMQERDE
jgi:hypothetical protein